MTQELKLGVVGYGTFCEQGGRGSGLTKLATTYFEGVRAAHRQSACAMACV